ncbi:MAG: thioredoxin family protein [Lentilitoribacter sp.]
MLLDTPLCDFGWKAPEFTLSDPDGQKFIMSEHLGEKGLLIAFICNHCPYVKAIGERLKQDTDELMENGVNVLAIMSNDYHDYAADSPENMKVFSAHYGFNFPYLVDETQSVGKTYNAICTPDFFGFNKNGELQYRGRLDDVRMNASSADRTRELYNAMMQIAKTGEGPREQQPSMGCSIKWR